MTQKYVPLISVQNTGLWGMSSEFADPVRAYHTAMFAFALYGILREWIIRDFDQPPEVMARIVRDTIASML